MAADPAGGSTPATRALVQAKIPFRLLTYPYDPHADAIGIAAAQALGLPAQQVLKTLVCALSDGQWAFAAIESDARLDLKALARALGVKSAELADPRQAEKLTGYVIGGISPLGAKRSLPLLVSAAAQNKAEILVNGGRRGLQIALNPNDLIRATGAKFAAICV
jgi:Cys-tRNA(Pro)/Cys-tRNA(Cys) deacylase